MTANGYRSEAPCSRGFYAVLATLVVLELCKLGAFIAAGHAPLTQDADVYWALGERIVGGDWLLLAGSPDVTRTPGYPVFVAFFQATCGRFALAAAIIAQHLLLAANAVLVTWICWRLNKTRTSLLVCMFLCLVCMSSHGVAAHLLSDALLSFLVTLCVVSGIAWKESPTRGKAVLVGLALGATIMVKPVAQYAWLIVCVWMLWNHGKRLAFRVRALHCGLAVAAMLLFVAPWLIRNQVCFGRPFLTRFAGRSLWWSCFKGNPADWLDPPLPFGDGPATRTVRDTVPDVNPHDTWRTFKALVATGYSESTADDLMFRGAKEAIFAHPGKFLASRCRRYVWFWITPNGTFRPNSEDFRFGWQRPDLLSAEKSVNDNEAYPAGQTTWSAAWYFRGGPLQWIWRPSPFLYALAALTTVTAICILLCCPERRGLALFLGLWLGYFSAMTALAACPEYRYRMILEPTMIVLVVCAAGRLGSGVAARWRRPHDASGTATGPRRITV